MHGMKRGIDIANSYRRDEPGFEFRYWQEVFLFSKTSRLSLGHTQPPIQWMPAFFPCVMRPGREVNHSPLSSDEVKNKWSYSSSPLIFIWR
jgi:hypothetical protein